MKTKHRKNAILTPSRKTFQNNLGKWVEKKTRTEILVCSSCGVKYIKTRKDQAVCIRCIYGVFPLEAQHKSSYR
ncbi:MAG: hypothetical protein A2W52_04410 [Candidatus Taylorbacteria bacterium RIFCSPHIGHO2_02_49_25]|uniref:Uncharacterized protein n=1 Tax=Candidatus Taylorbacteria bacterium RIFCSPHIGHO2_02_49_25 TaxID=1802305 RepID=A0A1G2MHL3_9BACT|nr:MAG: hypothetical protein A2759_02910 [Candidatus Taylorbacteria bacterium RIFCSPHIGHO2_01_FULL_49_60]OHA23395.1 MAG: hypothetical protein A2W52_04410 [Candidatus Taylorbacteria bacterium RIFCSPHIGHO2_02_49_25]OHA36226.1 MAG: hypothetical protein A2W65_01655 [Candidatus Taylorbacteria bacterium RIFCSPLOWO2_02_50_13]OHA36472.1 MAG: hypothetical protein A3B27_00460 [Candidatus Taylorbacteria bacterium RIFCSPLOWO2_01_FULL_50_130]OHA41689.1 MAG: hypothetical protein A3H73_03320 [Candidatus Taylo